ncbi:MAG: hypothetical protein ABIY51_11050, partial [Ferruginibacter sp.]
ILKFIFLLCSRSAALAADFSENMVDVSDILYFGYKLRYIDQLRRRRTLHQYINYMLFCKGTMTMSLADYPGATPVYHIGSTTLENLVLKKISQLILLFHIFFQILQHLLIIPVYHEYQKEIGILMIAKT